MAYLLLIEDDQNNANLVMHLLKNLNIEVRHYLRGLIGAEEARREHPALVLMDFNLPDIDGRALALVLRKQLGGTSAPPIIALTARAGETEMRMAQKFGCSAFVSKPFDPEELIALIKQLTPDLSAQNIITQPGNCQID